MDLGFLNNINFGDGGHIQGERFFYPEPAAYSADSYSSARLVAVLARDNHSLKCLYSGFVAFFYFLVDLNHPTRTEVGIFFEEAGPSAVKIEISSLSSTAQKRVAQAVFEALDKRFSPAS